jgi:CubicO group peptidase (beta-lactamase class C family)
MIKALTLVLGMVIASMTVAQEKPAAIERQTASAKTDASPAQAQAAVPAPAKKDESVPNLQAFRSAIQQAVKDRVIAGGTWWVEHEGRNAHGSEGYRIKTPVFEKAGENTLFDLASLTKVVATTPSMMLLIEQGRVKLDAPVREYLQDFTGEGRDHITVRQLMTHTSGLKPSLSQNPPWKGYEAAIKLACETIPAAPPDTIFRYSDINFILLGEIVRRVSGESLDVFAKKHIFVPLRMLDTGFNPDANQMYRIAATENDERQVMLQGIVHDPTSRRMAGVAGHAGLFSTAYDLARYARMILNDGELDGTRVLKLETVKQMCAIYSPTALPDRRALGWDVDTRYSKPRGGFPIGASFGHTGFTGTCIWIDPRSHSFYVFLGSRLHETDRRSDHRSLYEKLGTEAAKAVLKADVIAR